MMRTFYGIGILFALLLLGATFYFDSAIANVKSEMNGDFNSIDWDGIANRCDALSSRAGLVSLVLLLFFEVLHILTLLRLKTRSMKIFSIIGLVLTTALLAFAVMMVAFPGTIYFDEASAAWYAYGVLILGLCIPGLLQSIKRKA